MTNYEELYHALKVLKDYCEGEDISKSRDCEECVMSTNRHTCRIIDNIPAMWNIKEPPKVKLWED